MSPQREQREAIPAARSGSGWPWQRAEERAHWEQLQRRRGKALGELEKRSKREWSALYGRLKDESLDPEGLEADIVRLMIDDDVTKKAGIYPYLLTGEEKHLNIRAFSDAMKQKAFEIQNGICGSCTKTFEMSEMDADHITPWSEGGKTIEQNCQMLCKQCNRRKSNK